MKNQTLATKAQNTLDACNAIKGIVVQIDDIKTFIEKNTDLKKIWEYPNWKSERYPLKSVQERLQILHDILKLTMKNDYEDLILSDPDIEK